MASRRVAALLLATTAATAVSLLAQQSQTFHSDAHIVPVYATVQDRDGHLVPDLQKGDFKILDNGRPVEITTFSHEILPITVALVLDLSGGMLQDSRDISGGRDLSPQVPVTEAERHANLFGANAARRYVRVRDAAARFVDALLPADRVRIVSLGGLEVGLSPYLTGDKTILHRILREELWPLGRSRLWNGLQVSIDSLANEPGRKVVVLFSSGAGSCAPVFIKCGDPELVRQRALVGGFMLYTVGLQVHGVRDTVRRLSDENGGRAFRADGRR